MNGIGIPGRKIFLIIAVILVAFALAKGRTATPEKDRYFSGVPKVIDGDTIILSGQHIRIAGIDAPDEPASAKRASARNLRRLIERDGSVQCAEPAPFDGARANNRVSYDRAVLSCRFVNTGHDLATSMVAQGFAVDWKCFSGGGFTVPMNSAIDSRKGLWESAPLAMIELGKDRSSLESCGG